MRRRRRGGRRRRRSPRPGQPGEVQQQQPAAGQPEGAEAPADEPMAAERHPPHHEQQAAPATQHEHPPTVVVDEHRARAAAATTGPISCAIVSVSDTRNARTDVSGRTIRQHLSVEPYRIKSTSIVKDEPSDIRRTVLELLADDELKVIILTGGTGIGARDRTIEVLQNFFEKDLPGFGEMFRHLSYEEIGSAALLTRASAGIARRKFIAALPGSPQAVRLALEKILVPELPHILDLLRR